MAAPYSWTGRNGQRFEASEVEDNHLLFYFRMLQERLRRDGHSMPELLRRRIQTALLTVYEHIGERGLEPLPVRSREEQQEAEERRKLWEERGQEVQIAAVPVPRTVEFPPRPYLPVPPPPRPRAQKQARPAQQPELEALRPASLTPNKRKIVIKKDN